MRIGIDAREFTTTGKTGIARYLENLLAPLISKGRHNFILFARQPAAIPTAIKTPTVKIVPLPSLPTMVVDDMLLPVLAQREKIDLFFSPYYKVPLSGNFKRIITIHDIMFLRRQDIPRLTRAAIARRLMFSGRRADIILVDSDFTGKDLADFAPELQPKIRRLYPDLSVAWIEPVRPFEIEKIRSKYGLTGRSFLYTGNFKPHKNVDILVEAFAALAVDDKIGETTLVLAGGDARNSDRIRKLVTSLGLEKQVILIRHPNDTDLRALYAAADWFITASEYEGFGYPVLEAMVSGCPVICRDCTSLPEITGTAALTIKSPGAAAVTKSLRQALAMPAEKKSVLVSMGKKRATLFAPGSAASCLEKIIAILD